MIKPSILTIEKTMKNNLDEIKTKLKTVTTTSQANNNNNYNNYNDTSRVNDSIDHDFLRMSTKRDRNIDTKIDEITLLGEKLYDKLLEKVIRCYNI